RLEAQRVAGGEAGGTHRTLVGRVADQPPGEVDGSIGRDLDLDAVVAGVARAAEPARHAGDLHLDHVHERRLGDAGAVVAGGQCGDDVDRRRTLHGQQTEVGALAHLDIVGQPGAQVGDVDL